MYFSPCIAYRRAINHYRCNTELYISGVLAYCAWASNLIPLSILRLLVLPVITCWIVNVNAWSHKYRIIAFCISSRWRIDGQSSMLPLRFVPKISSRQSRAVLFYLLSYCKIHEYVSPTRGTAITVGRAGRGLRHLIARKMNSRRLRSGNKYRVQRSVYRVRYTTHANRCSHFVDIHQYDTRRVRRLSIEGVHLNRCEMRKHASIWKMCNSFLLNRCTNNYAAESCWSIKLRSGVFSFESGKSNVHQLSCFWPLKWADGAKLEG